MKDIRSFPAASEWRSWLVRKHETSPGVWLRIFKKTSKRKTITYDEALDEALCFGWIDGQKKSYDAESFLQRFTPRRPKSMWSKRNREHVARLIKEKRMTAAGLKEVAAAKKDGRWRAAYDAPSTMQIPEDFLAKLRLDRKAYDFFKTLNRANTYAIAWRLQTAKKPDTRARRMEALLTMLKRERSCISFAHALALQCRRREQMNEAARSAASPWCYKRGPNIRISGTAATEARAARHLPVGECPPSAMSRSHS